MGLLNRGSSHQAVDARCAEGTDQAPERLQCYSVYDERGDPTNARSSANNQTPRSDGYTLYRALSRQLLRAPKYFTSIRDSILHFAIRARSNPAHPLHDLYMQHEAAHRVNEPCELFAALDCPDLAPSVHLLWVVAQALNVRIKLFDNVYVSGKLGRCIADAGLEVLPTVLVLKDKPSTHVASFSLLLPDESGRALIDFLEAQRSLGVSAAIPAVKRMSWAWTNEQRTRGPPQWRISCYNEYRDASKVTDLTADSRLHCMDTFVVMVSDPLQIPEALRLLKEAIKRAPNQGRSVRSSPACNMRRMRPHCSADCEFVKLPRDIAHKYAGESRDYLSRGILEELFLCSLLLLAGIYA